MEESRVQNFLKTLTSERKNMELPEEYNYFGKLIGSWKIDYVDNSNLHSIKGEWHFSWILDGTAIQDVIILPNYELGTTIRVYNSNTHAWDIVYCYVEKIMRFEGKKEGDKIVLTNIDDAKRKWVFAKIEDDSFHWQDIRVKDNGEWQINFDLYAERII